MEIEVGEKSWVSIYLLSLLFPGSVRYVLQLQKILDGSNSGIPHWRPFQVAPVGANITDAGFYVRKTSKRCFLALS